MSKFVFVSSKPESLKKGEFFIEAPNFLKEISENANKAPRNKLTGRNQLRSIVETIGRHYEVENLGPYSVKTVNYEGRPYASNEELNSIVMDMVQEQIPDVLRKWVDFKIKHRPAETKLIYFQDTGIHRMDTVFFQQGLDYDHTTEEQLKLKKTKKPHTEESEKV